MNITELSTFFVLAGRARRVSGTGAHSFIKVRGSITVPSTS